MKKRRKTSGTKPRGTRDLEARGRKTSAVRGGALGSGAPTGATLQPSAQDANTQATAGARKQQDLLGGLKQPRASGGFAKAD